MTALIVLQGLQGTAQVEVYPFLTWAPNKSGNSNTTTLDETPITSTCGTTVYKETATFNGHELNGRIAYETGVSASANQGLLLSGKRKVFSIQGLNNGDIVKLKWADSSPSFYIRSKNVSYVDADGNNVIVDEANTTSGGICQISSDRCYTITDGNSLDIYNTSSTQYRLQRLTIIRPVITLGITGYATYTNLTSTDFALPEGLTAYTVTADMDNEAAVVLTPTAGIIPAGEGVVLKGEPNSSYILTQKTTATTVEGNIMEPVDEDKALEPSNFTGSGDSKIYFDNYLLGNVDGKVAFVKTTGNGYLAAGKSYLRKQRNTVSETAAKTIQLTFGTPSVPTGIDEAENKAGKPCNTQAYDLYGRKVNDNYKGIVVRNGKKIIQ